MPDDAAIEAVRTHFIVLFVGDLARGAPKSAEEYYQLYPGFDDVIAHEWRRLNSALAGAATSDPKGPDGAPPVGDDLATEIGATHSVERAWNLGKYRIEREIGRGGQGTVYLAWDTSLDRRVALKVLKASWTGSEAMVRRFELEAQALARMDPQGLAAVHDSGEIHGLRYFAMRYVEGRTLAQELAERSRPAGPAAVIRYVTLAEQAARALHRVHEAGLVHRDVKPGNLMITADGPVLLDFGVARFCETQGPSLTVSGDMIGTPAFMAPEQFAADHGRIDRRADVYGLAATLHEALTSGQTPSDAVSSRTTAWPNAFRPRPPARRVNPDVPSDLDAVLQAALDPDPDRRYATSAALADDLGRVRQGLPVAVRPRSRLSRLWLWCRSAPAAAALLLFTPTALTAGLVALLLKNEQIERASLERQEKQREADASALLARNRFSEFQRLDDLRRIQDLEDRERDLWPPGPETQAAMEQWIADAREVTSRLPGHQEALAALRRRGQAASLRTPDIDPVIDRKLHHEKFRDAAKEEAALPAVSNERRAGLEQFVRAASARIASLDEEIASRPVYRFGSVEDQWAHDNLQRLVARLTSLTGPSRHDGTIASMERRVELARSLASISLVQPAAAWDAAVRSIANPETDPAYGGLRIEPILGLVPIGRDVKSRLWEFAVVLSGTPPARDAEGHLVIDGDSSIVLVLIPGGTRRVGAQLPQEDDVDGTDHVDSMASARERPVHEVTLDPFFLSKFEMTQGQWLRATGRNPSHHHPDRKWSHGYRPDLRHPVERVSFEDCEDVLRRLGLVLPTEAQWEYAARAGTTTPWWCGSTTQSFLKEENLADQALLEYEGIPGGVDPERTDGWSGPAPVGAFPANPFGLHDVIGNVSEWCADGADAYDAAILPGDGFHCAENEGLRVVRGGAFNFPAIKARSSYRSGSHRTNLEGTIGVRPARALREP